MSSRLGTMLALAALTLSAAAAGADEAKPAPPHIAAVQTFLVAWGHERWDDLRGVAADSVTVQVADRSATVEPAEKPASSVGTSRRWPTKSSVTLASFAASAMSFRSRM